MLDYVSFRQHRRVRPTGRGLQNEADDCIRLHTARLLACLAILFRGGLRNGEERSGKQMHAETDPKLSDSHGQTWLLLNTCGWDTVPSSTSPTSSTSSQLSGPLYSHGDVATQAC